MSAHRHTARESPCVPVDRRGGYLRLTVQPDGDHLRDLAPGELARYESGFDRAALDDLARTAAEELLPRVQAD